MCQLWVFANQSQSGRPAGLNGLWTRTDKRILFISLLQRRWPSSSALISKGTRGIQKSWANLLHNKQDSYNREGCYDSPSSKRSLGWTGLVWIGSLALAALQRSSKLFDKLKEQQAPGSKHLTVLQQENPTRNALSEAVKSLAHLLYKIWEPAFVSNTARIKRPNKEAYKRKDPYSERFPKIFGAYLQRAMKCQWKYIRCLWRGRLRHGEAALGLC